MAATSFLFLASCLCALVVDASHFRGGSITWRPWNNTPSGSTFTIQIRQRWSWRLTYPGFSCNDAYIAGNGTLASGGNLICPSGNCGIYTPSPLSTQTRCTDYNLNLTVSSGEAYDLRTYPLNTSLSISFSASAWFDGLYVGNSTAWQVTTLINTVIRPDGLINTSPVAVTLPIIYKPINTEIVHVIQMSDFDYTDTLRCRWSNSSGGFTGANECAGVCSGVPGARLINDNCTIVFNLTIAGMYAAVALQIEDYYNNTVTTPMSSVGLQFLFYGYSPPSGCSTPPAIIGNRPNRACIGTPIGSNVTELVIVEVYCAGKNITQFITSTPTGMIKSAITYNGSNKYQMKLTWVPQADQYGPQSFCAGAIDNTNVQSNQWCITFLVGFESPNVIQPIYVQNSASPIGTVFQNHTTFSIQTSKFVNRPTRNGTYIYFWDSTLNNSFVRKYDCGWEPEVTYTGYAVVVRFPLPTPWIAGHFYYVTFDSGVASGTEFCGPESAPVTDPTYWVFNIWDPAVSSTTTTTTTPPTTVTATTRPTSTTSTNPLLTTTGIAVTNTTVVTTISTTTTTVSTTTAGSTTIGITTTAVTTESTVGVLYPKDLELACLQPVAIMTTVLLVVMMPVHALAMYAAFTKFSNIYKPANISARTRHKKRMERIMS